ncbi:MAG: hypothetical protein HW406_2239 [Candidatus Brocadiaceae bacterium]|nr:hypothetical protein [Candidatus Brocadiaceae bacterium]
MMLIGEQGVRLNLMQKWDMNELCKVGLSKQAGSNENFSIQLRQSHVWVCSSFVWKSV